jgi:hypothetical protein
MILYCLLKFKGQLYTHLMMCKTKAQNLRKFLKGVSLNNAEMGTKIVMISCLPTDMF